jgi:ZIP family zinc transporter
MVLNLSPVSQALLATCFTWFVTALGAAAVFFFKTINRNALDGMLGFAAGVMIAASFWLLLAPVIVLSDALAFAAGAMIFVVVEELIPESQLEKNPIKATIGAVMGFAVMMTLDVALG